MFTKLKQRFGLFNILFFTFVYIFILIVIFHSIHRPLWSDESWRPDDINLNLHIPDRSSAQYAPLSLVLFLFGKLTDLIYQNNFMDRLSTYLAYLSLIPAAFYFCKNYFNKSLAYLITIVTLIGGSVLEFSTQDKPYILDLVLVLIALIAYKKYSKGRLNFWLFTLLCAAITLTSFGGILIMPTIGVLWLYNVLKLRKNKKTKKQVTQLAIWSLIIIFTSVIYYLLFLRSQIDIHEYNYFSTFYPTGSIYSMLRTTFQSFIAIFGYDFPYKIMASPVYNQIPILPAVQQIRLLHTIPIIGLSWFTGSLWLLLLCFAIYTLFKNKNYEVLIIISSLTVVMWLAAYFRKWPFGDSRVNLFYIYLITILICYGIVKSIPFLLKKFKIITATAVTIVVVLIFPYSTVASALTQSYPNYISASAAGVQPAAIEVAKYSKPGDLIYVNTLITDGFQYYYQFSDYTKSYNNRSRNIFYGYSFKENVPFNKLGLKPSVKRMWIVEPYISIYRAAGNEQYIEPFIKEGYFVQEVHIYYSGIADYLLIKDIVNK